MDGFLEFSFEADHNTERVREVPEQLEVSVTRSSHEACIAETDARPFSLREVFDDSSEQLVESNDEEMQIRNQIADLETKTKEFVSDFRKRVVTWNELGAPGSDTPAWLQEELDRSVQQHADRQLSEVPGLTQAEHSGLAEEAKERITENLRQEYIREIEAERRSRQSLETVTPERKHALLGLYERAKPVVEFRALTHVLDVLVPGLGTLTRNLKTVWEAGEALTGDGPVRLTIPVEGYVGVTVVDSGRNDSVRLDITFSEYPTVGPEPAGSVEPRAADQQKPAGDGRPEVRPEAKSAQVRDEPRHPADAPWNPNSRRVFLVDPVRYDVSAVAVSVDTGTWHAVTEDRSIATARPEQEQPGPARASRRIDGYRFSEGYLRPASEDAGDSEDNGHAVSAAGPNPCRDTPRRDRRSGSPARSGSTSVPTSHRRPDGAAELDMSEFLIVVVEGDARDLHGHDVALRGSILGHRALHRSVFDPTVPASARKSADMLRRIGAIIFCDRALGIVVYIDVDLTTRKPSCQMIGLYSQEADPPLA